ncbi:hypothetical protein Tco_0237028 [Tanacetum coccineum]
MVKNIMRPIEAYIGKMQGFEVIVPGKATIEHTIIPSTEAKSRKDIGGAQNLLRIAIQVGGHHDQAEFAWRFVFSRQ